MKGLKNLSKKITDKVNIGSVVSAGDKLKGKIDASGITEKAKSGSASVVGGIQKGISKISIGEKSILAFSRTCSEQYMEIGETVTYDTSTEVVEPERIGSLIEDLRPGEKIKIGVKIQNISAANNEEITVHFNFAPVDCDEHFFIDEMISTGDVYCKSSGRN